MPQRSIPKPCGVGGCTRMTRAKYLYCSMHLHRRRTTGSFGPPGPLVNRDGLPQPTCTVDGCDQSAYHLKEWCRTHLRRWVRYGDPVGGRRARMTGTASERLSAFVVETASGCTEWHGDTTTGGYGTLQWEGRPTSAHRLSYVTHVGPIPAGLLVCHHCDNRVCVNPDHLFLGTHADNSRDMAVKGRANSKLSAADVVVIRAERAAGARTVDLARRYGVTPGAIVFVVQRRSWRHVA